MWVAGAQVGGFVLRAAAALVVARQAGAGGLGAYSLATTVLAAGSVVAGRGLDRAALRVTCQRIAVGKDPRGVLRWCIRAVAGPAVAVAAALAAAGGLAGRRISGAGTGPVIALAAVAVPAVAIGQLCRAGLRGAGGVRLAAVAEHLPGPAAAASAGVALLITGSTRSPALAVLGALVAAEWVSTAASAWLLGRATRAAAGRTSPSVLERAQLRHFAAPLWAEQALLQVLASAGPLLLGTYIDVAAIGRYAAAVRLGSLVGLPVAAAQVAVAPEAARLAASGDGPSLRRLYVRSTAATAGGGAAVAAALLLVRPVVLAAFGPAFSGSGTTLSVVVLAQVVNGATGPVGAMLVMAGRSGLRLANAAAAATATVVLTVLLAPRWGPTGAAAAVGIATTGANLAQVAQLRRVAWALPRNSPLPRADSDI